MTDNIRYRNYERTEHDDYVLNVEPYIGIHEESIELRADDGTLVGWKIQPQYS